MVASGCGKWEMTIWVFNSGRVNLIRVQNQFQYVQGLAYGLHHRYQRKAKVLKRNFSLKDVKCLKAI
jgi:hypothetical protein